MHAAMQPPKKGGTELPPRGVRPHQGAAAPLVGPPSHRLLVVGSSLGPDPSRGNGWSSLVFWWVFPFIFDLRLF